MSYEGDKPKAADAPAPAPPHHHHQQQYDQHAAYGTFEGLPHPHGHHGHPSYLTPQQQPVMGFPQPTAPPGLSAAPQAAPPGYYPHHGYQTAPGYNVTVEGRTMRQRRLPCCGIGIGWLLFILGFFLAAIPWYVGAIMLCFSRVDYREKPGYIGCTIAAVLATIAIVIGATKGADDW